MVPLLYDMNPAEMSTPRELDLSNARIAVLGSRGCGKTTLCARWCRGSAPLPESDAYNYGEELFCRKILYPALMSSKSYSEYYAMQLSLMRDLLESELEKVQNYPSCHEAAMDELDDYGQDIVKVQVLDGADAMQADYSELAALQMNQVDGFMLCFDVRSPESVETVELLHRQIWKLRGEKVPLVLCALKSDIELEDRAIELRQVAEMCDELQLDMDTAFFEVSALEQFGVHECFYKMLRDIDSHKELLRKERVAAEEELVSGVSSGVQGLSSDSELARSTMSPTKMVTASSWARSSLSSSGGKTMVTGASSKATSRSESRDNSARLAKLSEDSSLQGDGRSETDKSFNAVISEKARSLQMSLPCNTNKKADQKRKNKSSCGCVIC
ncbi:LAFA_0F18910g1_1 [Lachancea sp. 'fantastica']|nr:LAFA_0F18910g1_1 [Lachancea sp. 'fantastica']